MQLSMHNWMRRSRSRSHAPAREVGYESIEISGEPTKYDTKEALGHLKENGIRCWG